MKYYLSVDHIRTGTWAVELPAATRAKKKAIKVINRTGLEHLDSAIFVQFFRKALLTWRKPADSHVLAVPKKKGLPASSSLRALPTSASEQHDRPQLCPQRKPKR